MKYIKLIIIFLISLQLIKLPVYSQEPNLSQEIIGIETLQSDNVLINQLRDKGFIIKPVSSKQIYSPYVNSHLPIYVTADSVLQTFHTLYSESLVKVEEANTDKLVILLKLLLERTIGGLSIESQEKVHIALEKNLLALQLLVALLDKEKPSDLLPEVSKELALIESADKVQESPILGAKVNYQQLLAPKEFSEKRARLFRALVWANNWQLNLNNELEANQAFLLIQEFAIDERLLAFYKEVDQPFSYLFGTFDGLSIESIIPTIKYILGSNPIPIAEISESHLKTFQRLAERINPENQPFKLFGKRVGLKERLAEAIGEDTQITQIDFDKLFSLKTSKGTNLKLREVLLAWQQKNSQSYPSQLIDCFRALLVRKPDGRYQHFINTPEWQSNLNTTVNVSWLTHQQLITAPSKSKTVSGGSNRYHEDFHGYVEPNKEFFFALGKMSSNLRDNLIKLRIFIPELDEFVNITKILEKIVEKELSITELSEEEIDLLENFGEILAKLNFVAGNYNAVDLDQTFTLTVKNGLKPYQILVGKVLTLYVVAHYRGKDYLCQGAISTYSENQP